MYICSMRHRWSWGSLPLNSLTSICIYYLKLIIIDRRYRTPFSQGLVISLSRGSKNIKAVRRSELLSFISNRTASAKFIPVPPWLKQNVKRWSIASSRLRLRCVGFPSPSRTLKAGEATASRSDVDLRSEAAIWQNSFRFRRITRQLVVTWR